MNKIFGFTERSLSFWLSFFSRKEDSIIIFVRLNMALIGNGLTPSIEKISHFQIV